MESDQREGWGEGGGRNSESSMWAMLSVFISYTVGWAEKWKNDILKCADVDYYGTIYIKQVGLSRATLEFQVLQVPTGIKVFNSQVIYFY